MNEMLSLLMLNVLAAPPVPDLPPELPAAQVIRWPGGCLILPATNGREMILRQAGNGTGSTTVIRNSGNGFGNRIVVGNGAAGGTTVIQNSRNGVGNRIILDDEDLFDLPRLIPQPKVIPPVPVEKVPVAPPQLIPPAPQEPVTPPQPMPEVAPPVVEPRPTDLPVNLKYTGKDASFWTVKRWSDDYDCNLYWCPKAKTWFRYNKDADEYRTVAIAPAPPSEK